MTTLTAILYLDGEKAHVMNDGRAVATLGFDAVKLAAKEIERIESENKHKTAPIFAFCNVCGHMSQGADYDDAARIAATHYAAEHLS